MFYPNIGRLSAIGEFGLAGRVNHQNSRIQAGLNEGSLSPSELDHLRADRRDLTGMVRNSTADGTLGPLERLNIQNRLNDSSGDIFLFRHNF